MTALFSRLTHCHIRGRSSSPDTHGSAAVTRPAWAAA